MIKDIIILKVGMAILKMEKIILKKDDVEDGNDDDQNAKVGGLTSSSRLHCLAQLVKISIGRPIVTSIIA